MDHPRNEVCINFQDRIENATIDNTKRIVEVEKVQAVTNSKMDDVCVKLDNQTKAIWGLVVAIITTMLGFIITIILMV